MLLKFIGLIIAILIWVAMLWLVLPFDFFKLSLPAIVALHALPPIAVWLGCYLSWRWHKQRKAAALGIAQKSEIEEQARQREIEHKKFKQKLIDRRTYVECRWVSVIDLFCQMPADALPLDTEQTKFLRLELDDVADDPAWPVRPLTQLLDEIFASLPIAASFPIQIHASLNRTAESITALVRKVHAQALENQNLKLAADKYPEIFVGENSSSDVYTTIQNQFSNRRDWSGLIVVAFDKLWKPHDEFGDWSNDSQLPDDAEKELWRGKPGGALCGLVFTRQHLQETVMAINSSDGDAVHDHMLPHWDREKIPAGISQHLCRLPTAWRQSLLEARAIAYLHRSAHVMVAPKEMHAARVLKISQAINDAAINSAMIEPVFEFEGKLENERADETTTELVAPATPLSSCGWLVHNAGTLAVCGDRLASLASALWENGIELNPIDQATNTTIIAGYTGVVSPWLQLAIAIGHTAANSSPTMLTEFENSSLWINLLSPSGEK